jgi:hypothetical protein
MLNGLARAPVLTIGEIPGFTEQGGIINLLVVENPATVPVAASSSGTGGPVARKRIIRFEVNAAAAKNAGIVLHPALVKLGSHASPQ